MRSLWPKGELGKLAAFYKAKDDFLMKSKSPLQRLRLRTASDDIQRCAKRLLSSIQDHEERRSNEKLREKHALRVQGVASVNEHMKALTYLIMDIDRFSS